MRYTLRIPEAIQFAGSSETFEASGWVDAKRDHGKLTFIDLRDNEGNVLQVVGRNKDGFNDLNREDVVTVAGQIVRRPEKMVNPNMPTGNVELFAASVTVLNKCKELPIPVDGDGRDVSEEMRLKYRYLDLRRPRMQRNMKIRAEVVRALRQVMDESDLTEIETPILTQATQEGARDFVVPSRLHEGKFYALPQSPQQYKQLLMTAGFKGYYQIARCFRDEALRLDRGFEFTQLDLEMSFIKQEDIFRLIERAIVMVAQRTGVPLTNRVQFPQFTYEQCMAKYGNDKPDIRTDEQKEKGELAFCWVTDFPMFESVKNTGFNATTSKSPWTFMHNPFSKPKDEHREWHLKGENVDKILSYQYDLVCNGMEIGSGSIRSHSRELLEATYKIMGYTAEETNASVGHMLEAFDLGTPPHGGIALGVDRLTMLVCGEESMKEVIPFPMTGSGKTAVMGAPS